MSTDFYYTIDRTGTAEFRDKGSRFVAIAIPVVDVAAFKEALAGVKKDHPKATHHCFAYRIGLDGNSFRVSDDGEPSGTAGRPILGQIDSKQASNILIVVARYFGGTLLGVPGLINAYKSAASMVLQVTPLIQKPVLANYRVNFDYTQMNEIMRVVKQFDCLVIRQEMGMFCSLEIGVPRFRQDEVLYKIREIRGTEVS